MEKRPLLDSHFCRLVLVIILGFLAAALIAQFGFGHRFAGHNQFKRLAQPVVSVVKPGRALAATRTLVIDDNAVGTGTNQFEYVAAADWKVPASPVTAKFQSFDHYSSTTGSYYQYRFTGIGIALYATLDAHHGIAAVSIDGGAETNVDYYAPSPTYQAKVFDRQGLPDAAHIVKVRVTGTKNVNSTGFVVTNDRADATLNDTTPPPPPPVGPPPPPSPGCPTGVALPNDRGIVTSSFTIAASDAGTYKVWSRLRVPSLANNSYWLKVDNCQPVKIGDSSTIPVDLQWHWIDYRDGAAGTSQKALYNLAAGSHTIKMAGAEDGVQLDKVMLLADQACTPTNTGTNCEITDNPPAIFPPTASPNPATIGQSVTLSAIVGDDHGVANVEFWDAFTRLGTAVLTSANTYSYTWNTAGATAGTHQLHVVATDDAGQTSNSANFAVTLNAVANARPTVSNLSSSPDPVQQGSFSVLRVDATDDGAVSKVEFFIDGTKVSDGVAQTNPNTYAAFWDTRQVTVGTHQLTARATDNGSPALTADTAPKTVTVTAASCTSAPVVSMSANPTTVAQGGIIQMTANATACAGKTIDKVVFWDGTTPLNPAGDTTTPYDFDWVTTGASVGQHNVFARATDSAGVKGDSSNVVVTINPPADTTKPSVPINVTATSPNPSQIIVSWDPSTDTGGSGLKGYQLFRGTSSGNLTAVGSLVLAPSHSYTDSSLSERTTYYYAVTAIDNAGNSSAKSNPPVSATTGGCGAGDQPPSQPQGLQAVVAAGEPTPAISLSWTASTDDHQVLGYHVYRGNNVANITTQLSDATGPSYIDRGLSPGATYYYKVAAFDDCAHGSVASSPANATLPGPPDTSPPSVPANLRTNVSGEAVFLSWDASTDNTGVTVYHLYRGDSATNLSLLADVSSPSPPATTFTDNSVVRGHSYYYAVSAGDAAGNGSVASSPAVKADVTNQAVSTPLYRFFHTRTGEHFFTVSLVERDYIIANYPLWVYEGPVFRVYSHASGSCVAGSPMYRFFNTRTGFHFFTISAAEKDAILANPGDEKFENVGFCADTTMQSGDQAVYRFFNTVDGQHLFTASQTERDYLIANAPDVWHYENIGFYSPTQ